MSQTMSLITQVVQMMAHLQGILLTGHFPVVNTPCEIPDLCVKITFSELEYSQGLVNWHGRLRAI
jgi:hypothetical protein